MKKVLIVATTVFHVIVAVQMKRTILKNKSVDIILGDETPNMKNIADNLENIDIFENVYFVKMNDYNKQIGEYEYYTPFDYCTKKYFDVHKMFSQCKKYDIFLVPFFHHFHMNLYSYIKRFINKNIRVYLYEEGVAIYSGMGSIYRKKCEYFSNDKVFKFFHYGRMLNEIKGIVTFNPGLLQWGENYKKIKIPYINKNDSKMLEILNTVFGYNGEFKDEYDKKIIFFEEAKAEDGIKLNDIGIVNRLSEIVGKENILIKLHPRSTKNRFSTLGYKTNNNTLIPWEVIFMNHDFSNTLFISTASSSIMHPVIIFKEKINAIFLFKMIHSVMPSELLDTEKFIENVVVKKYTDCFDLPCTIDELSTILLENKF